MGLKILDVKLVDGYEVRRLSLVPHVSNLDKIFDVGAIELRRLFEIAVIDENLNVAFACKSMYFEISIGREEAFGEKITQIVNEELFSLDNQLRTIRLLTESSICIREFVFKSSIVEPKSKQEEFKYESKVHVSEGYLSGKEKCNWNIDTITLINSHIEKLKLPIHNQLLNHCHVLYDQSYHQLTNANALLLLVICLEMLFLKSEKQKKENLSRCSSIFLGENEQDILKIYANVKSLYNKRSQYVHEGDISKISIQDILLLRKYVRKSLLLYLSQDGSTKTKIIFQLKEQISKHFPNGFMVGSIL